MPESKKNRDYLYYSYGADWKHPYFYSRENGWASARPAYAEPQSEYMFTKDEDLKIYAALSR